MLIHPEASERERVLHGRRAAAAAAAAIGLEDEKEDIREKEKDEEALREKRREDADDEEVEEDARNSPKPRATRSVVAIADADAREEVAPKGKGPVSFE